MPVDVDSVNLPVALYALKQIKHVSFYCIVKFQFT